MLNEEVEQNVRRRFELIEKIGSGAYGTVWKARNRSSQAMVAVKKIYEAFNNPTDAQRTLREVLILRSLQEHPHINHLIEVIRAKNNRDLYLILEYVNTDLTSVFQVQELKYEHMVQITYQLLTSLKYIHSGAIIHRDLKPSNVLISYSGEVKLCDFGLARSIYMPDNVEGMVMTEKVSTRWYRAPELLFYQSTYGCAVDIWSLGCIFGELICGAPLFQGNSNADQIERIISALEPIPMEEVERVTGSSVGNLKDVHRSLYLPLKDLLPDEVPQQALDFLRKCLTFDPRSRISASEALAHEIFRDIRRTEVETSMKNPVLFPSQAYQKLNITSYQAVIYALIDPLSGAFDKHSMFTPKTDLSENTLKAGSQSNYANLTHAGSQTHIKITKVKKSVALTSMMKLKTLQCDKNGPDANKELLNSSKQNLLKIFFLKDRFQSQKKVPQLAKGPTLLYLKELLKTEPGIANPDKKKTCDVNPILKMVHNKTQQKSSIEFPRISMEKLLQPPKRNFQKVKNYSNNLALANVSALAAGHAEATPAQTSESRKRNPVLKHSLFPILGAAKKLMPAAVPAEKKQSSPNLPTHSAVTKVGPKDAKTNVVFKSQASNPSRLNFSAPKTAGQPKPAETRRSPFALSRHSQFGIIMLKLSKTKLPSKVSIDKSRE